MIVFEYKYNRARKKSPIGAMGFVDIPAIEKFFKLHLRKQENTEEAPRLKLDKQARIVTGPIMIPDIKIYRTKESLGTEEDGFIYFSRDTVKKMFEDFMESDNIRKTTLNHEMDIEGCSLIEAWLTIDEEKDKSAALGIQVPVGTAMASYKVHNDEVLGMIERGEINGFSIEAENLDRIQVFNDEREVMSDNMASMVLKHLKSVGQTLEELKEEGWELIEDPEEIKRIQEIENPLNFGITSTADQPSELDRTKYQVRYAYKLNKNHQGEDFIISTSRNFCKEVHEENKWYRKEDIESATNPEFGTYNILKYAGSYGCRHFWEKNYFSKGMKFQDEETEEVKITRLLKEGIEEEFKKSKKKKC